MLDRQPLSLFFGADRLKHRGTSKVGISVGAISDGLGEAGPAREANRIPTASYLRQLLG